MSHRTRDPETAGRELLPQPAGTPAPHRQALHAAVMEAYVHGVSTRSVDNLVKTLRSDTGISKSKVSRICAGLDEQLDAFRTRPLDHIRFLCGWSYFVANQDIRSVAWLRMVSGNCSGLKVTGQSADR